MLSIGMRASKLQAHLVSERFNTEVKTRYQSGRETKSVAIYLEHARLAVTDLDRSDVLLVSKRIPSGLIFIADWFSTVQRSVSSRKGWGLFAA